MRFARKVSVSKYGNRKTNGYASKREAKRAQELKLLEREGKIAGLREQVTFELIPAQYIDGKCVERSCKYVADFCYSELRVTDIAATWEPVVEDCKGFRDPVYRLKRKLMLHLNNLRIRET